LLANARHLVRPDVLIACPGTQYPRQIGDLDAILDRHVAIFAGRRPKAESRGGRQKRDTIDRTNVTHFREPFRGSSFPLPRTSQLQATAFGESAAVINIVPIDSS